MELAFPLFGANPLAQTLSLSKTSHRLLPPRPILVVSKALSNQSYWASINADIESHLKRAIPIRPPLCVFEPMHRFTFDAPETTAPALCIAACELVGGRRDQATAAASALQLMHAAACMHEQLPISGMPEPKKDHAYGPSIELLTADGMVPFGFELLAGSTHPDQNDSGQILRVIIEVTRAIGSQGFINGRFHELQWYSPSSNGDRSTGVEWIDQVCMRKEGALHSCAGACGAILGGGSEEEIKRLRMFGVYAGMIQGIVNNGDARREKLIMEEVSKLRDLALQELQGFDQERIRDISSLVTTINEGLV